MTGVQTCALPICIGHWGTRRFRAPGVHCPSAYSTRGAPSVPECLRRNLLPFEVTAMTSRTGLCSNPSNFLRSTPSRSILPTLNSSGRSPFIIWRLAPVRPIELEARGNLGRGYLQSLCLLGNPRRFLQIQFPDHTGPKTVAYFLPILCTNCRHLQTVQSNSKQLASFWQKGG